MFIDTSALVALLAQEPDAVRIAQAIEAADNPKVIALVRLEAAMVLSSVLNIGPEAADVALSKVFQAANIQVVSEDDRIASAAVAAFAEYGKGRGHPARLNLADCMVYAAAKLAGETLLFIGEDYSHTDITSALEDPRPTR
jgi:ribonuclease VapC